MRTLVLTLMMSFLSHSAFAAGEGGGLNIFGDFNEGPLSENSSLMIFEVTK